MSQTERRRHADTGVTRQRRNPESEKEKRVANSEHRHFAVQFSFQQLRFTTSLNRSSLSGKKTMWKRSTYTTSVHSGDRESRGSDDPEGNAQCIKEIVSANCTKEKRRNRIERDKKKEKASSLSAGSKRQGAGTDRGLEEESVEEDGKTGSLLIWQGMLLSGMGIAVTIMKKARRHDTDPHMLRKRRITAKRYLQKAKTEHMKEIQPTRRGIKEKQKVGEMFEQ